MKHQRALRQIEKQKTKVKKIRTTKKRKTLPKLRKSAQFYVNKFIRDRDSVCISCGRSVEHAGHYISRGASGYLRFHPDNLAGQCAKCNTYLSGNIVNYRYGLLDKIGKKRVEWLEENRHKTHKYTREQLQAIRDACKSGNYTREIWEKIMKELPK